MLKKFFRKVKATTTSNRSCVETWYKTQFVTHLVHKHLLPLQSAQDEVEVWLEMVGDDLSDPIGDAEEAMSYYVD